MSCCSVSGFECFLIFFNKIPFKFLYNYHTEVSKLMNDTNWVKSHCSFLKTIHFQQLIFTKILKISAIKTLGTVSFLSYPSILSLSLNDDLTKIRQKIYYF